VAGSLTVDPLESAVKRARVRGWSVGAGVVGCWVVLRAVLASLEASSTRDVMLLFSDALLLSSTAFGIRSYARALPSAGVIIWLRRFRVKRSRSFGMLLEQAARGVGYPLTLQDSSYRWSLSAVTARAALLVPLALLLWVVGVLLVALLVFMTFGSNDRIFVLALIAFTVAFLWAAAGGARRLGFRTVDAAEAVRQLSRMSHSRGRGRQRPFLGIEVLKVQDSVWETVVRQSLAGAVLAVIDVSDVTDNIRTELRMAFATLGRDRVILAVEEGARADAERIWHENVAPVRDASPVALAPEWVASALFVYSARRPRAASSHFRREVQRLRAMMVKRLPASPGYAEG